MLSNPIYLNKIEDNGILCVKIKFIDIQKNAKSEGNFMSFYWHWSVKQNNQYIELKHVITKIHNEIYVFKEKV